MIYLLKTCPLPFYVCQEFVCRGVFNNEHVQSHARYGLLAFAPKKRQMFDHPQRHMHQDSKGHSVAIRIKTLLDKLFCVLGQGVTLATSNPQHHAHKQTKSFSKRTLRRQGQAQVNALACPTRCLTEVGNRILQPYSVSLKPLNRRGETTVFRKMPSCQHRKIDPRSARLNYVPAQIWSCQTPIFHPIKKQKPHMITNTCPKTWEHQKFHQTHTQFPAKTWKLTFQNRRYVIKTP